MVPVVDRAAQLRMPTSTRGWASTALVAAKTLISAPARASVRCMTNPPLLTPVHPTGASDRVKTRHRWRQSRNTCSPLAASPAQSNKRFTTPIPGGAVSTLALQSGLSRQLPEERLEPAVSAWRKLLDAPLSPAGQLAELGLRLLPLVTRKQRADFPSQGSVTLTSGKVYRYAQVPLQAFSALVGANPAWPSASPQFRYQTVPPLGRRRLLMDDIPEIVRSKLDLISFSSTSMRLSVASILSIYSKRRLPSASVIGGWRRLSSFR